MEVILVNMIVQAILLTFAMQVKSSPQDERQWLYKLTSSLQKREGRQHGQAWNMFPYGDVYSSSQVLDQMPELGRFFEISDKDNRKKKSYPFDGLLCCNHPPTKPPSVKRSIADETLNSIVVSDMENSLARVATNSQQQENGLLSLSLPVLRDELRAASEEPIPEIWDSRRAGKGDDSVLFQRRGVTEAVRKALQRLKRDEVKG